MPARWFIDSSRGEVPYGIEGWLGGAYPPSASPNGRSSGDAPSLHAVATPIPSPRASLVHALTIAGSHDEAMAAATGLIDAAEATRNPWALSFALLAYGFAFRDADPDRAREVLRRGLVIAQDSGNRFNETHLAASSVPTRGRTRRPAGRARLHRSGHPQLPRLRQHRQYATPLAVLARFSTGSDATNQRPPSPVSRSIPSPQRGPDSPPRSPTYAMSSATRPTNRSPARARR